MSTVTTTIHHLKITMIDSNSTTGVQTRFLRSRSSAI